MVNKLHPSLQVLKNIYGLTKSNSVGMIEMNSSDWIKWCLSECSTYSVYFGVSDTFPVQQKYCKCLLPHAISSCYGVKIKKSVYYKTTWQVSVTVGYLSYWTLKLHRFISVKTFVLVNEEQCSRRCKAKVKVRTLICISGWKLIWDWAFLFKFPGLVIFSFVFLSCYVSHFSLSSLLK